HAGPAVPRRRNDGHDHPREQVETSLLDRLSDRRRARRHVATVVGAMRPTSVVFVMSLLAFGPGCGARVSVQSGTREEDDGPLTKRGVVEEGTFAFLGCDLQYVRARDRTRFDVRFLFRAKEG